MLRKTPLGGKNVEVTFRMPPLDGVVELYLCGDFNDWRTSCAPLAQEADGSWAATLVLEAGRSYRFRYCDNQRRWHNDWEADAYLPNDFGSEDSVVDLTGLGAGGARGGAAASTRKKSPKVKPVAKAPATRKAAAQKPAGKKPAGKSGPAGKDTASSTSKPRRAGGGSSAKGR